MKRILLLLFTLGLLLSAFGKAPAEPAGVAEPPATEIPAETIPSPAELEQQKLEEGEKWLSESFTHWGQFYAKN